MVRRRCRIISIMTNTVYFTLGLRHAFLGAVNNGANASKLRSNLSKSPGLIHLDTLLPYILRLKGKLRQIHMQYVRSALTITMYNPFQCCLYCVSLVNPDSCFLIPKEGFRWHKLLVNLAHKLQFNVFERSFLY